MNNLNYCIIPQETVKAIANRYIGNSLREAVKTAKNRGEIGEPIMAMSKNHMSIVYYPNPELNELVIEAMNKIQQQKQAIHDAEVLAHNANNAVNRTRNMIAAKLKEKGISFKIPAFN